MALAKTNDPDPRWRVTGKWGDEVASAGFAVVPNHLLAANLFLSGEKKITPTEVLVLLQILAVWWSAERWPFPSKTTLARRAGLSPRQVQRTINGLVTKDLVRRITRFNENMARTSNEYDLGPVVDFVKTLVRENPKTFKNKVIQDEGGQN